MYECNVRGQMGVQILQAFTALAGVYPDENPKIIVNTGGVSYDSSAKIEQVFDSKIPIEEREGTRKSPYWNQGMASRIFRTRARVASEYLVPRKELYLPATGSLKDAPIAVAVHMRGKDKPVATAESYIRLVNRAKDMGEPVLFSDDRDLVKAVSKETKCQIGISSSAVEDYKKLFNARVVFCVPNAFIMSMLLINPNKKIMMAGRSYCDGSYTAYQDDLSFAEEAVEYCKNWEII